MAQSNKNIQSPLVEAVFALDTSFAELARLGSKIDGMELRTDTDFERVQNLLNHFTECAQGVSTGVVAMSNALNEARLEAEAAAQVVSIRAEELQTFHTERQKKMEDFRLLGEKVQALNSSLNELKQPEGQGPSEESRAKISMRFSELELELGPLIEEAQKIKTAAQTAKMATLEQNADALKQSLTALRKKLNALVPNYSRLQ